MKYVLLILISTNLSLHAHAADMCGSFFSVPEYRLIGRGEEAKVYEDVSTGNIKKVFKSANDFYNAIRVQELAADALSKAGFKILPLSRIDKQNLAIYREYVDGVTLETLRSDFQMESSGRAWRMVEEAYEVLVENAKRNLQEVDGINFQPENFRSYMRVLSGHIVTESSVYSIRLHEQNIIVKFKDNKPEFYIIDFR